MNIWTQKSIELANQRNYLDLLYKVYPMSTNLKRELSKDTLDGISKHFNERNSEKLLNLLLKQEIFPIKDSYVAYLKKDLSSIGRNPNTVERITGMLYEMGLDEIIEKSTVPKETNRQIGPMFKEWIDKKFIGCNVVKDIDDFIAYNGNVIYNASDSQMQKNAKIHFGYTRDKGIDFFAKFNDTIILSEAKFLTDFGGHQNAQFEDAISTMQSTLNPTPYKVKIISILDGVLYIDSGNKMHKSICNNFSDDEVIISSILLRDYLYSI